MSKIKQPISYPIFTFRWLAIHGIAVQQFSSLVQSLLCNLFKDRSLI